MPSSASDSIRFELQAAGENLNTWGDKLNAALEMLEAAGHGVTSHTLTANKSLTYTNYTSTDGTDYVQKIEAATDGTYTLTLGGYERSYLIWNASSYDQTIACSGGGDSATVYAGEVAIVFCDGTNVVRIELRNFSSSLSLNGAITGATSVEGLTTPASADTDHAANVQFVLDQAFAALNGDLPGQSGNAGAVLSTDGTTAEWQAAQSAATNRYFLQSTGAGVVSRWADLNAPLWRWRRKRA